MEFEILVARFRKLHAVIFGLAESGKTKAELKEEFLALEAKIKDEARRDGGIPNQLIQKIYDDFGKVRTELELTTITATEDVVEETKVEVITATEETSTETVEEIVVAAEAETPKKVVKKEKVTK